MKPEYRNAIDWFARMEHHPVGKKRLEKMIENNHEISQWREKYAITPRMKYDLYKIFNSGK